jgi:hypothetical protein
MRQSVSRGNNFKLNNLHEGKKPVGKPRCKQESNIKIDYKEIKCDFLE